MEYDFTLRFKLPDIESSDHLVERLGEAGCDDAVVGTGVIGHMGLNFLREASSAKAAVIGALQAIRQAVPGAELIEATPDYAGLSDVAQMVGVSRQNLRKLMTSHPDFPAPLHAGTNNQAQVWHLAPVLQWLQTCCGYKISSQLIELAHVIQQCNLVKEASRVEPQMHRQLRELVMP